MPGRKNRGQNVRSTKCRKRRAIHHRYGEKSKSAQMAKHGRVVDRMRLGARRQAGGNFEKR